MLNVSAYCKPNDWDSLYFLLLLFHENFHLFTGVYHDISSLFYLFLFLVEHYSICIVNKLDVISEMPVIVTGGRRAHGKFYFASLI